MFTHSQYNDEITPPLDGVISLEYLAGLIDGEGCLDFMSPKKYKYPQIRIALKENESRVLFLIKDIFGGRINHRGKQKSWKDYWSEQNLWTISGKDCNKLLKKLFPYLVIKKQKAEVLLSEGKQYE